MDAPIGVLEVIEATTAGTKKHVLSLVKALDPSRFTVTVACPPVRSQAYGDTSFVEELGRVPRVRIELVDLRRGISAVDDARAVADLRRVIKSGRYHIVHAHSSKAGALGRLAAKWAGTPVILYTPHGFAFRGVHNPLVRRLYIWVERVCGLWTDRIICVSPTEKTEALDNRIAPADKLVVIENGLNLREVVPPQDSGAKRRQLGLDEGAGPIVGTMGRLARSKGLEYFLQAAAMVLTHCPDVRFLIVGSGEAQPDLEQLAAELGIAFKTIFTGFRPDGLGIMRLMDVFVLPSPYEAMPYTILEAMACSKPVVAIQGTGAQDAVQPGTTGLLVPPRDSEALADSIMGLLRDMARARDMGLAGRQVVASKFTLDRMVQRTQELYTALCETKLAASYVPGGRMV